MKKTLFTFMICLSISSYLFAQNAQTTNVEFNNKSQTAVSADFEMPGNIAEGAIKKRMKDDKIKGGSSKDGFISYQEVVMQSIRPEKIDVYFKVEDKKTSSTVNMLVSKGYENFVSKESDPEIIEKMIGFMTTFKKDVMSFGYNDQIEKLEEQKKDKEKDLKKAEKNSDSDAKDKAKYEKKKTEKTQDAAKLKSDLDNQQKTLEFVKAKTGTVDQMNAIKKEISKQEDAVKSAEKKYNSALKDVEDYTQDISKKEGAINQGVTEQTKLKSEIESIQKQIAEIKGKLNAL